jgi:putative DNA primase/helicase
MPRPHLRTGFRQPKLREWVGSHRACLVWSALSLVRAWIAAGRPKGKKGFGMYESYSEVIGGILEVANVPGFLDIPEEQARLEDEESDLAPLIPVWRQRFQFEPVSAAQLLPLCTEVDLGGKTEQERKIRLGKLLRANRDRVFGEVSIVTSGSRDGSNLWRLMPIGGRSSTNGQDCEPVRARGVGELGECFASSPSRKNE